MSSENLITAKCLGIRGGLASAPVAPRRCGDVSCRPVDVPYPLRRPKGLYSWPSNFSRGQ
jgi:hypothetical protein